MSDVLQRGIDWNRTITITDDDTGTATVLAGKTIVFQLRRVSPLADVLSYSVGAGITLSATQGVATMTIPAADSEDLEVTKHVYRILCEGQVVLDWTKIIVRD